MMLSAECNNDVLKFGMLSTHPFRASLLKFKSFKFIIGNVILQINEEYMQYDRILDNEFLTSELYVRVSFYNTFKWIFRNIIKNVVDFN